MNYTFWNTIARSRDKQGRQFGHRSGALKFIELSSKENIDLPFGQTQSNIYIEYQLLLNIKLNRDDWWLLFYDSY